MKVVIVGRDETCDVKISDVKVSRKHLQLVYKDNGECSAIDLDSTNGTFVNGKKIADEIILKKGDKLQIGDTLISWQDYGKEQGIERYRKEQGIDRRNNKKKYIILSACILLLLGILVLSFMIHSKNKQIKNGYTTEQFDSIRQRYYDKEAKYQDTEKAKNEAEEAKDKALGEKADAEAKAKKAEKAKKEAEKAKKEAEKAKKEAEEAKDKALGEKNKAEEAKKEALEEKNKAEEAKKEAEKAKNEAEEAKDKALGEKEEFEKKANAANDKLCRLLQDSFDENIKSLNKNQLKSVAKGLSYDGNDAEKTIREKFKEADNDGKQKILDAIKKEKVGAEKAKKEAPTVADTTNKTV